MEDKAIRILLIEDSPGDVRLITEELSDGTRTKYDFHNTVSLAEGIAYLESAKQVDVILEDLFLPDSSGLESFHQIHARFPDLPVVILTGSDDHDLALQAVKEGAQDYIVKGDIRRETLERIMRYAIERNRLLVELESKNQALQAAKGDLEVQVLQRTAELQTELAERQKTEKSLAESREHYQSLFESNHAIMLLIDPETGEIFDANPAASAYYGWPHETLTQINISQINILSEEEVTQEMQAARDAQRDQFIFKHQRADGTIRDVEVFSGPISIQGRELLFSIIHDVTDRMEAEAALRDSVSIYHDLVETSQDLIWQCNAEGRYTYLNPAWEEVFGYKVEAMLGKKFSDFQTSEVAARDQEEFTRLMQGGSVKGYQTIHIGKTGNPIHLVFNAKYLTDKDGNITGTRGTAYDITKRVRSEQALLESESQMQSIFKVAPVGIGVVVDRILQDVNDRFCEISGYPREELIGQNSRIVYVSDEEYEFVGQEKYRQIQARGTGTVETRFRRKDEKIINVLVSSTPIDLNDLSAGVTFTVLDITDRVNAVAEINRQVEGLAALVDIGNQFTATLELEHLFQATTDGLVKLVGLESSAIYLQQGENIYLWATTPSLPSDFPQAFRVAPLCDHPHIQKAISEKTPVLVPDSRLAELTEAERQVSEARDLRTILYLPIITQEETRGILIVGSMGEPSQIPQTDIDLCMTLVNQAALAITTAQYHSQLQKHAAELEQRVAERTAQLELKSQELEAFAYSVSHDLKAPLRGIDGYSNLLQKSYHDRIDEEGQFFLTSIRQATRNMHQLIDDLLAYSRLESREMSFREIDHGKIIDNLLAEFSSQIEVNGVTVSLRLPCDSIYTDPGGLTQILRNLIDNALKFTVGVPEPRIEIGGNLEEHTCVIWLRDNGVGFDMKVHERIFEIFQRLHRAEDFPGTGIGLAIVAKAMQRMNGRVWAESEPGQGATFYLEFPRNQPQRSNP